MSACQVRLIDILGWLICLSLVELWHLLFSVML